MLNMKSKRQLPGHDAIGRLPVTYGQYQQALASARLNTLDSTRLVLHKIVEQSLLGVKVRKFWRKCFHFCKVPISVVLPTTVAFLLRSSCLSWRNNASWSKHLALLSHPQLAQI